jgi:hypothetical protein
MIKTNIEEGGAGGGGRGNRNGKGEPKLKENH